jgi:serine/threonine protein phosphatase PrpC
MPTSIITASATRTGTENDNADAASTYTAATGVVGTAVIDGIGHSPGTSALSPVLAVVAARTAATRGALAGLLSAAQLVSDPGPDDDEPNAVSVVATTHLDGETVVAWVGDCDAYGWDGTTLARYTTPHTVGEQLRHNGAPWEIAEAHDNWIKTSLAHAVVATIQEVTISDPVVLLLSDGIHDQIPHDDLTALVRDHATTPQALATALVTATTADADGYRDDATAVVISVPSQPTT